MEKPSGSGGKRVLIADDERHFRFSVSLALKRQGHIVVEAGNGVEALEEIRQAVTEGNPFDLLICDLEMAPVGGLELIDSLKNKGVTIPVLVVSGYFDDALFSELVKRALLDYMEKPISPGDLMNRVDHLLGAERQRPAAQGVGGRAEGGQKSD